MRIELSYGKTGYVLGLPDDWDITVVRKKPMPVLPDPQAACRGAFERPVGSEPLRDLARGRRSACIAICDITRPVPNGTILPPLLRELLAAGLSSDAITVIVATGLHRPNEGDELVEVVGDRWVLDTVPVVNHVARNDADHVSLGTTGRGTPVSLDRRFVEADLKIVVGLVEPHFMAGYSGGRKVITPGVAHHETIRSIHSARFLEHDRADNCVLDGNPVHEEIVEIARMVGECFAVNVVIDEARRISFVNFGALEESHGAAVAYVRPYAEVPLSRRYRTVVTTSAGHPLDRNYYQTVKGMVAAMGIVEPGGNLFVVSECSEGLGSPEYGASQQRLMELGAEGFMRAIRPRQFAGIDEWETEMQLKAMRAGKVHLFSGCLCDEDRALTGLCMVESLEEAVHRSVAETGDKGVAVIPEGPYVIPVYQPVA